MVTVIVYYQRLVLSASATEVFLAHTGALQVRLLLLLLLLYPLYPSLKVKKVS